MKVIGVIPAYQEGPRIGATVAAVRPFVDGLIVVDDGSRDGTADAAQTAGAVVLVHPVNRGQGAALKTGTMAALARGADVIVHVDADGQHDPSFITALVDPIRRGEADVTFGSRFLGVTPSEMPWARCLLLAVARLFNTFVMGIPTRVTDPQSGMRALSRAAAERVAFHQDRMAHCSEILRIVTRSGLRWSEVPIHVRYTSETLAKGQKPTGALRIAWELFVGAFRK